jgi:putative transposase
MKKLNLTYALYYKRKYGHLGHFWQDRFKSLLVEKDVYLLALGAYVELNPVKAGMVDDPAHYPHSSYAFYARGESQVSLTPNPLYEDFGDTETVRRTNYQAFVSSRLEDYDQFEKSILTKRAFGSEPFLKALEGTFKISISRQGRGRPKKEMIETLRK